jgi:histone-lysine N-methyltransferase ASH1L
MTLFFFFSDENGKPMSRYFNSLPSRKAHASYTVLIAEPIDLQQIERNINTGFYASAEQFDGDLLRLFQNNLRYHGRHSSEGQAAVKLRALYNTIKSEYHGALCEALGPAAAVCFLTRPDARPTDNDDDDAIHCVCGQYKDEGLMVQCERCHIWQHCDCVGHPDGEDNYYCQDCDGPKVDLDIKLIPQPEYASPGETYHVSLMREDLQIRLGDTVYVLRAFKTSDDPESSAVPENDPSSPPEGVDKKDDGEGGQCFTHGGIPHKMMSPLKGPAMEASALTKGNYPTYKTVGRDISTSDMDIFRIERLWTNEKGERFAFGHHYLRPHETFHEPNRKFFRNEVFRVPLYEVLPLDTIWGQCWVLDLATFCKGRPAGSVEEHVYICEFRVDKSARLFNKISKPKYPICTKKFAFDHFDQRLRPTRIYTVSRVAIQLPLRRTFF